MIDSYINNMPLSINGPSGLVGTNFKRNNPDYTIQDFYHTYKAQPEGVDVSGSSIISFSRPTRSPDK